MKQRFRISGFIALLLVIISVLLVWLGGQYLLLRVFGFLLFIGTVIYLTVILLCDPSHKLSQRTRRPESKMEEKREQENSEPV